MKVVIVGQGYVGLPLALAAARKGLTVFGFDKDINLISELKAGKSRIEGINHSELESLIKTEKYIPTSDPSQISKCNVAIIAVPTPLDSSRKPDLRFVELAAEVLGKNLILNSLIINESTSYPGTLRNVIVPIIENLKPETVMHQYGSSPERVDPGNKDWKIENTPRLFSGVTEESAISVEKFYRIFSENLIKVATPEVAEMAKLFENTYRQVNIALVNELAIISNKMGIDVMDVINAASTKPYGFQKFIPGIGVGGHCIPVDPSYLSYIAGAHGVEARFIELANEVNLLMPKYIVDRIQNDVGGELENKRVIVHGITYKSNIADTRESPSELLIQELRSRGANVKWNDPLIKEWNGEFSEAFESQRFDIAVLAQAHHLTDLNAIMNSSDYIFDCTNQIKSASKI